MKETRYMQTNKVSVATKRLLSAVAVAILLAIPALAKDTKPTVAIIKAEWCAACQKLEPEMMKLMGQYKDRLNFVVLDVSTDEKANESAATARKLGLSRFFEENKQKTSTVAVFVKGSKPLFQTMANFDRDAYVRAFEEAIAKARK
jgi:thiol-disulfide isomerase/thioredoxin